METSYRIVLVDDANSSVKYLQHYGVKGMKWGVVHDDKKTSRSSNGFIQQIESVINNLPADRRKQIEAIINNLPPDRIEQIETSVTSFLQTADGKQLQEKINGILEDASSGDINFETVQEIMGVASDVAKSEELMEGASELIDAVKDVALDELEKENPVLGKTAKVVDNFIDGVKDFIADFTQGVKNIVSGIVNWGKNLFSWF